MPVPIDLLAQPADILRALPSVMAGAVREPLPEVVRRLRAAGLRLPSADEAEELLLDAVDAADSLWAVDADDAVVNIALVMTGRVFTHRLSAAEVADGRLRIESDFPGYAFDLLTARGLTLPDGRVVSLFDSPGGPLDLGLELAVPKGTYAAMGLGTGDLVAVALADGVARLIAVPELGDPGPLVADLAAALADLGVAEIDKLIDVVLVANDHHFRAALPPITEILAGSPFGRHGHLIAATPEALAADRLSRDLGRVIREFELEPDEARVVVGALWHARTLQSTLDGKGPSGDGTPGLEDVDEESIARWAAGQLADLQAAVAAAPIGLLDIRHGLTDPWLAFATADQALATRDPVVDGLELLCQTLAGSTTAPPTRAERAGLEYLLGRCRERVGDPRAAERHFTQAMALDAGHSYALLGLAGIAADRGQYEAAQGLIERAGADEHHPLRTAVRIALESPTAPARLPGRNEPCWCGSGRKFKVCHARVSTSPLPSRARGLLGRAVAWLSLTDPGAIRELLGLGMAIGGEDCFETLASLVPDVLLFEGGALADYLDRRADLIPDDEAMLAQQWLLRPRSLFEVEAVEPGQGMRLRDLMTGDRVDVVERTASSHVRTGDLLLTRVGNLGDHDELFGGGTVVSIGERGQLLELLGDDPRPLDLVQFVARRYRPPEIQTNNGDPLEFIEGTYTTTAPAQLRRALDERLDPAEEGSWNLLEKGSGLTQRVLGSVDLSGRTLTASAMSRARYSQLLEILDGLDVPLVEKSREVRGMEELRGGTGAASGAGAGSAFGAGAGSASGLGRSSGASSVLSPEQVAESPELLAHMAAYIAEYERSWLDESIPALDGVTPREAAADPTRRRDLIALLDSFPSTGSPLEMDGRRLKAALGLEE